MPVDRSQGAGWHASAHSGRLTQFLCGRAQAKVGAGVGGMVTVRYLVMNPLVLLPPSMFELFLLVMTLTMLSAGLGAHCSQAMLLTVL